jgi:hypothetical protein
MPATKTRPPSGGATRRLPPVTVARFEEAGRLLERLVEEKADVFLAAGQRYRDRHADTARRELTASEAAEIAAGLAAAMDTPPDIVELAAQVQASELRATPQPAAQELLLAAGLATAPALVEVTRRFVALIELGADEFEEACEADELEDALDAPARALRALPLDEARVRTSRALEHFAAATGHTPGEAWALLARTVGSAFTEAMRQLAPRLESASDSLTGSPPPTAGPAGPSSTTPATATP